MKKQYKEFYRAIKKPQILSIPRIPIISICGEGNPNNNAMFQKHIEALYKMSYAFRMSYKKDPIEGYETYTVGPLEGFWSTIDNQMYDQNKEKLTYEIFIIQPDFITQEVFSYFQLKLVNENKYISDIKYSYLEEGLVAQILHVGSFDNELETVSKLEEYVSNEGYKIINDSHHEIYLSDFRRVQEEKYKTLIRYKIEKVK